MTNPPNRPVSARLRACLAAALAACAAPRPAATEAPLTLEEKVGQLFVVGAHAKSADESTPENVRLFRLVRDRHVGGVIWYRSTIPETVALAARLQEIAKLPVLFACDLEAGMGMRFDGASWAPPAMAIGATGDPSLAERLGRATAEQARALGIHQIYAPVADVNVNPSNPVIDVRSFGGDANAVGHFVAAFCHGVERGGGIATVKHFPGHGDTSVDSHRALPVLRVPRSRMEHVELEPYREALLAGARSVMTAHLAVPALDDEPAPLLPAAKRLRTYVEAGSDEAERAGTMPASVSKKITTELLRGELGFQGLVVTDAMDMGGLADHFDQGEGAVRAILAGADQVLKPGDDDAAIDAVLAAVRSGRIPESRIDESVDRVLREKRRLGLFERRSPPAGSERVVGNADDEALLDEIACRAVTLLREEPGVLPLKAESRVVCEVQFDAKDEPSIVALVEELRRHVASVQFMKTGATERTDGASSAPADPLDVVLTLLFPKAGAHQADLGGAPPRLSFSEQFPGDPSRVIASFGTPYVFAKYNPFLFHGGMSPRTLAGAPTMLAAYGPQPAMQRAVARALCGKEPIGGKLPVTVGRFRTGAGIEKAAAR